MLNTKEKKWFHWAFIAGAVLKAIDAFIELIGGILIFLINKALVVTIVLELTREELLEDPKDLIANYLVASAHTLTVDTQYFIALYLIVHGIIKIILSISLLKKKYWAYPAAIFVFALFVVYQIFRWSISGSIWYVILSILDIIFIYLTWYEYKNLRSKKVTISPQP